jgi:hypothetical protein
VPGKQYVVLREFSRVENTGATATYAKDDLYSGPIDPSYLDNNGPDGKGPLVVEKAAPITASKEKS